MRFPLSPATAYRQAGSPTGGEGIIIFDVILGLDLLTFGIHLNFGI